MRHSTRAPWRPLGHAPDWLYGPVARYPRASKGSTPCSLFTWAGVAQVIREPAVAAVFTNITRSEGKCRSMLVTTPPVRSTRASGRKP